MCGRFAQDLEQKALEELYDLSAAETPDAPPSYNICPTQDITVVRLNDGHRALSRLRWGFVPHWYKTPSDGPLLINARSETLADKPAFRAACRSSRCLIPANGFYEWCTEAGVKQPWYIQPTGNAPLAFAGICQDWTDGAGQRLSTCAIVTTAANATLKPIHHRMPVVIEAENFGLWLGEAGKGAARLMRPAAEHLLRTHKVSAAVNSARASGAELTAAI
ncbi:SOS response-associated peptidase [Halovulum sp. GXIMD14793]